jgi:membrane protease YdiL (CAAX protease family)
MSATLATPHDLDKRKLVAPLWHTALLILILFGVSTLSARMLNTSNLPTSQPRIPLYISVIISECALVYFVAMGLRRTGTTLKDLIGWRWRSPQQALLGAATAAGFFLISNGILQLVKIALKYRAGGNSGAAAVLPHGTDEMIVFALVSVVAGITEEIIFRGYLQRQFAAITKSWLTAVLAQAAIFGFSHGYQGLKPMITITVYGAFFGLLAHWSKSLMPGIIAHAWQDIFSGIISR